MSDALKLQEAVTLITVQQQHIYIIKGAEDLQQQQQARKGRGVPFPFAVSTHPYHHITKYLLIGTPKQGSKQELIGIIGSKGT